jgi:cytochrome c-type biogenesis protein CcmH/NrfG
VLAQSADRNPRKVAEATAAAERAHRLDPGGFEAWWSLAEVRLAAGELAAARAAFGEAEQRTPADLSPADRQALSALRQRLRRSGG